MSPGRDKDADVEDGHGGTEQEGGGGTKGGVALACIHRRVYTRVQVEAAA